MTDHVKNYYNENAEFEWNRLNNPYSKVEFETTKYLLKKYLPKEGLVLDIGSGPGRYSLELLKLNYQVSLLDLSKKELAIAKEKITDAGFQADAYYCRSAIDLDSFESNSFDAILLMGPLYHIHKEADRSTVLKHVYRILKPGGIVLISYINTWGVLKAAVSEFPESFADKDHFEEYINGDLKFSHENSFTTTFFTTPPLALAEVEKSDLNIISYAGAESYLAGLNMQLTSLYKEDKQLHNIFVSNACEYCEMPQYRDATEHLHIIARKDFS